MKFKPTLVSLSFALSLLPLGCAQPGRGPGVDSEPTGDPEITAASKIGSIIQPDPREVHFGELRMLTDGGENAEAYFAYGSDQLIFQSTREPYACDQIFTMNLDGSDQQLVSTGAGRTTCAYFYPDDDRIIYASTHEGGEDCPPTPDHSRGYVWPLYPDYDLYLAKSDGTEISKLTDTPGYDAEATVSPTGDRVVFTSTRDGDLDIYAMNLDGTDVVRLTEAIGYDGGPFYSPTGPKSSTAPIIPRIHRRSPTIRRSSPTTSFDRRSWRSGSWTPTAATNAASPISESPSFAPFFNPAGDRIVFSSNHGDPSGREFELFMVDLDGENLEQITFSGGFDGFPMFAPDGETFVFCSNRNNTSPGETNVFVTTWKD